MRSVEVFWLHVLKVYLFGRLDVCKLHIPLHVPLLRSRYFLLKLLEVLYFDLILVINIGHVGAFTVSKFGVPSASLGLRRGHVGRSGGNT